MTPDTMPTETIETSGFPLGFRVASGTDRPSVLGAGEGREIYVVEARKLAGHQKEAVVREGAAGSQWRLTSDEGGHINGTDLAPFPLGFFNAGLQGDVMGRMAALAKARDIALDELRVELRNGYWLTGSFVRGTGEGFAEPAAIKVILRSDASADEITRLVSDAVHASPALAAMANPLVNTFALYINGRRRTVSTLTPSASDDAPDPFVTYGMVPSPRHEDGDVEDLIRKTGQEEAGEIEPAPAGTTTRIVRVVRGVGRLIDPAGVTETDTWLEMPGMSHFALRSSERADADVGPTALAHLSAGVAFCFMTQLDRYIHNMKFDIDGVRLVQYSPFAVSAEAGRFRGGSAPFDTHLFLNGREADEAYERLMHIAARTCYLHSTLAASLDPQLAIELNGEDVL